MSSHPILFNAHHSPVGAYASLTLGDLGAKGGLANGLGEPSRRNFFAGAESPESGQYEAFPFFDGAEDDATRFDVEGRSATEQAPKLLAIHPDRIARTLTPSTDTWTAGDLTLRLITPALGIPDPQTSDHDALRAVLAPAVYVELTLDNRAGTRDRKLFLGFQGPDPYDGVRHIEDGSLRGVAQGGSLGLFSLDQVTTTNGFSVEQALSAEGIDNQRWMLGGNSLLYVTVPAGTQFTLRAVAAFYRSGRVTTGLPCQMAYARLFGGLEEVASYALARFAEATSDAKQADARLDRPELSVDQRFQLAHAIHSYFGSTQMLWNEERGYVWMVNEGEYRMMNTFDLTADHLFFELELNPWVVRNVLDLYVDRYSYDSEIGGTSVLGFTHDMGVSNQFSRPGYSSYERSGLTGCFSYMTHEELVNWIVCAATYAKHTGDTAWASRQAQTFGRGLASLVVRDADRPEDRDGVMGVDDPRCKGGSEITTYDSLDESLGQARNNGYLAVKTMAAYMLLSDQLPTETERDLARTQAKRAARTVLAAVREDGTIPALLGEPSDSVIIPLIEGLVFPHITGLHEAWQADEDYSALLSALRTHTERVLASGACLFSNGAWRLSSTSDNSWLSKIYLCQFVARKVLGFGNLDAFATADAAHVGWLTDHENRFWAWSDQIVDGVALGSKYYPRGVTSWLWLTE